MKNKQETNKECVLEAFDTLFNKRDYAAAEKFWSPQYIQHSAHIGPGREGLFDLIRSAPVTLKWVHVPHARRLGRSLGQVIHIVDELVKRKIRFTAIKESIHFEGKQDLQTKVMVALFGLFAEVERDLISERTREGLASARAKGRLLGRPKGVLGKSRLDGKEEEIRVLLQKQVSKASIAKIVGVTRPTIYRFIKTRRLRPHP